MTATYHPTHFKVSDFPLSMRNDFRDYSTNVHDGMIMHYGYPDLVHGIMKILICHGFTF